MSTYRLSVSKEEPNPEAGKQTYDNYGQYNQRQPDVLVTRSLEVTLTEAEYQAVKKAVLEVFQ